MKPEAQINVNTIARIKDAISFLVSIMTVPAIIKAIDDKMQPTTFMTNYMIYGVSPAKNADTACFPLKITIALVKIKAIIATGIKQIHLNTFFIFFDFN